MTDHTNLQAAWSKPVTQFRTGLIRRSRVTAQWRCLVLLALATLPFLGAVRAYFYYDDGTLLLLVRETAEGDWRVPFSPGFHGHLRPLPIATLALVYRLFGVASAIPYHLVSLGLHAANAFLIWSLLHRLLGDRQPLIPFGVACVCAVHWWGSEAVTYVSGIGVLFATLGGLIAGLVLQRYFFGQ